MRPQDCCPHFAGIERTLPRRVAPQSYWELSVGVCIDAGEVGDDLDWLPEDSRKKGSFGACGVDGPGSATCASRQARIALSTEGLAEQKCRVAGRWRNRGRSGWRPDALRRCWGDDAE